MRYSLMTEPQLGGTYAEISRAARHAESEGLVSFARSDHLAWDGDPMEATDAFATLGGLARDTSSIRLCVLVTPITFRHPAIIAKNAATIDQMSAGRFDLGVGTGWNDYEHHALGIPFPDSDERWGRFEDALGYLRAAFADGKASHDGPYYSLDHDVMPKPTGIRLVIGGSGPKRTPTLAGATADEYNFFVCPPDEAKTKIAVMRDSAGGRPVEPTVMGPVVVEATESDLDRRLEQMAAKRGITVDRLRSRWDKAGMLYGTPDAVAEKTQALEEAGVERIYMQWVDLPDFDGLARMVEMGRS